MIRKISVMILGASFLFAVHAIAGTASLSSVSAPPTGVGSTTAQGPLNAEINQKMRLEQIKGDVFLKKVGDKDFSPIKDETSVNPGDTLKTEEGVCMLVLENQATLFIAPKTVLEITEASLNRMQEARLTELNLQSGRLKAKISKLSDGSHFQVRTPTAIAAVRGTLLFINTGILQDKGFTEVYVDETTKGVDFKNTITGEMYHMDAYQVSSAFGDGTILVPSNLSPEEQKKFIDSWEAAIKDALAKGDIEEMERLGWKAVQVRDGQSLQDAISEGMKDAAKDKQSEQNAFGQSQQPTDPEESEPTEPTTQERHDENVKAIDDAQKNISTLTSYYEAALSDVGISAAQLANRVGGLQTMIENGTPGAQEWSYNSVKFSDDTTPLGTMGGNGDQGIVAQSDETESMSQFAKDYFYLTPDYTRSLLLAMQNASDGLATYLSLAQSNFDNETYRIAADEILKAFDTLKVIGDKLKNYYPDLYELYSRADELREAERQMMRDEVAREIYRIKGDLTFEQQVAAMDQSLDAKTGKVFTDIHGNRVRVDQYIFRPSASVVQILSLTLRTAGSLQGVSSVSCGINFNKAIDTDLKSLPWDDYFRVVTKDQMAIKLGIPTDSQAYKSLADQFIVYSHLPEGSEVGPSLYPVHFYVELKNPVDPQRDGARDMIRFDDVYDSPTSYLLPTEKMLWCQPQTAFAITVAQAGEDRLTMVDHWHDNAGYNFRLYVNGNLELGKNEGNEFDLVWDESGSDVSDGAYRTSGEASQSPTFASDFMSRVLEGDPFTDLNTYLGDVSAYPANMWRAISYYYDDRQNFVWIFGGFVPIDNAGKPIDAPGFSIKGVRDIFSRNSQVNNGNYNLETIFAVGTPDSAGDDGKFSGFNESFRIDTIITPEIFTTESGFNTLNLDAYLYDYRWESGREDAYYAW